MRLELYDDTGSKIDDLNEDSKPLGFYSPNNGYMYIYFFNEDFRPLGFYSPHNWQLCMCYIFLFILFFIIPIISFWPVEYLN